MTKVEQLAVLLVGLMVDWSVETMVEPKAAWLVCLTAELKVELSAELTVAMKVGN